MILPLSNGLHNGRAGAHASGAGRCESWETIESSDFAEGATGRRQFSEAIAVPGRANFGFPNLSGTEDVFSPDLGGVLGFIRPRSLRVSRRRHLIHYRTRLPMGLFSGTVFTLRRQNNITSRSVEALALV